MEYCSDVMIVKMADDDYYVSEKIQGKSVHKGFLKGRSLESPHFDNISAARQYAQGILDKLNIKDEGSRIVDIDYEDFLDKDYNNYVKAISDSSVKLLYDNYGLLLGTVNDKENVHLLFRPEELGYRYIDIEKYTNQIDKKIEEAKLSNFDFYNEGKLCGYRLAKEHSFPTLHYEIYVSENSIKEKREEDNELYECDIQYSLGYIEAIKESIELLKKSKIEWQQLGVHIINLQNNFTFDNVKCYGKISKLGEYKLFIHQTKEEFERECKNEKDRLVQLIYVRKTNESEDEKVKINLMPNELYSFINRKISILSDINTCIRNSICALFRLSN